MIETERLFLRRLGPQDEAAFLLGVAEAELRRLYCLPADLPEGKARRLFARFSALPGGYGLVRRADGALVGFLLDVPSELPEAALQALPEGGRTLAYATFAPYRRQGYMREALAALIDRYRRSHGAPYLHGGHFPDNDPSKRLLSDLGFIKCGQHTVGQAVIVDQILFL